MLVVYPISIFISIALMTRMPGFFLLSFPVLWHSSIAMLHRPLFHGTNPEEIVKRDKKHSIDIKLASIWISYCNLKHGTGDSYRHAKFTSHRRLASPEEKRDELKNVAGAHPVLTKHGWMIVYHGVHELAGSTKFSPKLRYSTGVMILAEKDTRKIVYRSPEPVLVPELPGKTVATISNVVFPTGTDHRHDIGQPDRIDVYYGMADDRIGVAKMNIPDHLPAGISVTSNFLNK